MTDNRGCTLDLFTVAYELLEIQPRYVYDARRRGSLMEASGIANAPSADLQV